MTRSYFFPAVTIVTVLCFHTSFSQNIAVNTSGTAAAAANMFEVTQPTTALTDYVSVFARNLSTATNAYAIWAEATGAATGKYAIVVPNGGGYVGIGTSTPLWPLDVPYTITTGTVNARGAIFQPTFNSSGNGPGGIASQPLFSPTANLSIAYGMISVAIANPPAGVGITNLTSGFFRTDTRAGSAGTVTDAIGVQVAQPGLSGITPANTYGVNIANQGAVGMTKSYGLYVSSQSGATNSYAGVFQGGNVGIGTITPTANLEIKYGGGTVTKIVEINGNNATNGQDLWGLHVSNTQSATGALDVLGGRFLPTVTATSGTTTNLYGMLSLPQSSGAGGTITNAFAGYFRVDNNAGTVSNSYGVFIGDPIGAGTTTNKYALVTGPNAGNVGIGTISPITRLQVSGGDATIGEINPVNTGAFPNYGRFLNFSGGPAGATWNSENSDPLWIARYNVTDDKTELRVNLGDNTNGPDKFVIGNSTIAWDKFVVQTDGNVGIGTASPGAKLHVNTTAANDGLWLTGNPTLNLGLFTNAGAGAYNPITQANDRSLIVLGASVDNPGGGMVIAPWRSTASGIRIDGTTGYLGVGISTPSTPLHAISYATGTASVATFESTPGAGGMNEIILNSKTAGNFKNNISFQANGVRKWSLGNDMGAAGAQTFSIYDATVPATRFLIDASGNVGLGTTSFTNLNNGTLLTEIHGTGGFPELDLTSNLTTSGSATGLIDFGTTGTAGADKRTAVILSRMTANSAVNPAGNLEFWTMNNGALSRNMVVDYNGNVGIGTPTPSSKLTVEGGYIQGTTETWGHQARTQGLIIMPEANVTDDGAGNIVFTGTLIVMNPLGGSWIRVAAGSYTFGAWGYMWIDIPPTGASRTTVTPTVSAWADADVAYPARDRILIGQRNGAGKVFFNFGRNY